MFILTLVYYDVSGGNNKLIIGGLYTLIILLISYVVNDRIHFILIKRISDANERFIVRKAFSTIISILIVGAILVVWLEETVSIVVAYGILSAGIAIALQDILKNIAGGIILLLTGPFKVGDRIQVDDDKGDVLGIKIFLYPDNGNSGVGRRRLVYRQNNPDPERIYSEQNN